MAWIACNISTAHADCIERNQFYDKSFAVVVGIKNYKYPDSWKLLKNSVNDAESIAKLLREECFDVELLVNDRASKLQIESALNRMAKKVERTDSWKKVRVLFYFAGHGYTDNYSNTDYGYIVPWDGLPDTANETIENTASYISMDQLHTNSQKLSRAKHQLFVMDSCFGGLLLRDSVVESRHSPLLELAQRYARQILTAGGKNQRVQDNGPAGHSIFTYHLIEALHGAADADADGYVTFAELASYIITRASSRLQTPSAGSLPGDGGGQYIFISRDKDKATRVANSLPAPPAMKRSNGEIMRGRNQPEPDEASLGERAASLSTDPGTKSEAVLRAIQATAASIRSYRRPPEAAITGLQQALKPYITHQAAIRLEGQNAASLMARFSHDNKRIVVASTNGQVAIWNALNGKEIFQLKGHNKPVWFAEFSPNDEFIIASADDGKVILWKASSGEQWKALTGHTRAVRKAAFSMDSSKLVTGSDDGTVRLWDVSSGECLSVLKGHSAPINAAVFSPDGRYILSASRDRKLYLWSARTGDSLGSINAHEGPIHDAKFLANGDHFVSVGQDGYSKVWMWKKQRFELVCQHKSEVPTLLVATSSETPLLLISVANGSYLIDARTCAKRGELTDARLARVYSADLSPDGSYAAIAGDSLLFLWDIGLMCSESISHSHTGWIRSVQFGPDGRLLISAGGDGKPVVHSNDQMACLLDTENAAQLDIKMLRRLFWTACDFAVKSFQEGEPLKYLTTVEQKGILSLCSRD